jgi:hypothetical protein
MFGLSSKGTIGLVLMLVGVVGLFPSMGVQSGQLFVYALAPAMLVLTLGTWMVGTDMQGRPV